MAFSAGPYGAALNDGSEYNGSYASKVSEEQIMDFHAKRLHVSFPCTCMRTMQKMGSCRKRMPISAPYPSICPSWQLRRSSCIW